MRDLPITLVKLDKDFARTVSEEDTQELVRFVVTICNNMELGMLAEGIETEEQQKTFHRPQFLKDFKEEF